MDPGIMTVLMASTMMLLFAIGCPVAFSLLITAVIYATFLWGPSHLYMLASSSFGSLSSQVLIAIPLFILMGNIMIQSGIAKDMFASIYCWAGRVRGSLAMGTIVIASMFSAFSGSSSAMTVTIGKIAIPTMLEHGYDKRLALGTICVSGIIDFLIPPSILAIILGSIATISIGRLYLAMFIPGFLLAAIYLIYIGVRSYLQPHIGPATGGSYTWGQKLGSLRTIIIPALIVFAVLGTIYTGVATPTEAAGIGAGSMMIAAAIQRSLTWKVLKESVWGTLELTSMIAWMMIGVTCFTNVYDVLGGPEVMKNFIYSLSVGPFGIIILMQISWFILGCFMDDIAIMMLTIPLYMPIVKSLGFDPIWFAVLFMVNIQTAWLTPPFGMSLFLVKAIAPKDILMDDVIRGALPFIVLQLFCLALMMAFPSLALWLPDMFLRK